MIKQTFLATSVIGIIAFVTGCSGSPAASDPISVNGSVVSCVYGGLPAVVTIGAGAPAGSLPPGVYTINKLCTKCDKSLTAPCKTLIPFPGRAKGVPIPGLTTSANISSPFFTAGLSISISTSSDATNCSACVADGVGTGLHVKDLKATPQSVFGVYAGTTYTGSPTSL